MRNATVPLLTALFALSAGQLHTASAQGLEIRRNGAPGAPFSSTVWAGDLLFVSGTLADAKVPEGAPAGTRPSISGDTRSQTHSVLVKIQKALQEQGLSMGDVVQMNVYLVADPTLAGRMDFAGMNAAYAEFFGTASQPNKPTRSTVQVAALAINGALVEIDVIAARPRAR
ncbi:MAG: hypothetical protein IPG49_02670 [Proteobacteria bacterium]|nr:hypothetical protein [Pseudomonadota bacterium]